MGTPTSPARPPALPARPGARPAVQLGGVAQALPQVHEPQEVPPDGSVPQDGQGQQRADPAGGLHRRNHRNEVRHVQAGDERGGRPVRSQRRGPDRLAGVHRGAPARLAGPQAEDGRGQDPRRGEAAGDAVHVSAKVPRVPGRRGQVPVWRLPEAAPCAYSA
uniref:(northern house mosquito) hypothetical protein n=1 Tax=Culex pipiens TaxID=7175 RepID=A0A8D8EA23_CULPI